MDIARHRSRIRHYNAEESRVRNVKYKWHAIGRNAPHPALGRVATAGRVPIHNYHGAGSRKARAAHSSKEASVSTDVGGESVSSSLGLDGAGAEAGAEDRS